MLAYPIHAVQKKKTWNEDSAGDDVAPAPGWKSKRRLGNSLPISSRTTLAASPGARSDGAAAAMFDDLRCRNPRKGTGPGLDCLEGMIWYRDARQLCRLYIGAGRR